MKTDLKRVLFTVAFAAASAAAGYVIAQQQDKPSPEVRRVVTRLDGSGKAVVMIDERTPLTAPRPPNYAANVWVTSTSLPDFGGARPIFVLPRSSVEVKSGRLVLVTQTLAA